MNSDRYLPSVPKSRGHDSEKYVARISEQVEDRGFRLRGRDDAE